MGSVKRTYNTISIKTSETETIYFKTQKEVSAWFGINAYTKLVLEAKCKRLNYEISFDIHK